ncbi:MAG TPA: hypothetical protein VKZ79_03660 [Alphaproteobacteria bacterium]|nr:hypothetical protein [Alphaproteobacteria bacterium]
MQSFLALRRLHARGALSRGLTVDPDGVMLGPDCVLIRRTDAGYRVANPVETEAVLRYALRNRDDFADLPLRLDRIARALEAGDLAKAQILGLQLGFDDLDDDKLRRLDVGATLVKEGYDPNQPRDEDGRWTSDGGTTSASVSSSTDMPTAPPTTMNAAAVTPDAPAQTGDIEAGSESQLPPMPVGFNDEYHNAVRDDLAAAINSLGGRAITEVSLTAFNGVKSRIDLMVLDPKVLPTPFGIEVKTGLDPILTRQQSIVYAILMAGGNVWSSSPRLPKVGLSPGARMPPVPVAVYWKIAPDVPGKWIFLSPEFVKMDQFRRYQETYSSSTHKGEDAL